MIGNTYAFSGFSVDNIEKAKQFYGEVLGINFEENEQGLMLLLAGGSKVFVYEKENHEPATFTILNFEVDDIDKAFDSLVEKGVKFEHYLEMTDEKGIARGISNNQGPDIAWFKDPAGNFLSILKEA